MRGQAPDPLDVGLLAALRGALARPFADPVAVIDLPLSRKAARALEREIGRMIRAGGG